MFKALIVSILVLSSSMASADIVTEVRSGQAAIKFRFPVDSKPAQALLDIFKKSSLVEEVENAYVTKGTFYKSQNISLFVTSFGVLDVQIMISLEDPKKLRFFTQTDIAGVDGEIAKELYSVLMSSKSPFVRVIGAANADKTGHGIELRVPGVLESHGNLIACRPYFDNNDQIHCQIDVK